LFIKRIALYVVSFTIVGDFDVLSISKDNRKIMVLSIILMVKFFGTCGFYSLKEDSALKFEMSLFIVFTYH